MEDNEPRPRFVLLNEDELQDYMNSAESKNTKNSIKYVERIVQQYCTARNTTLEIVDRMNNDELDNFLRRFYMEVRQVNGEFYCKKTMQTIRYGLQRRFKDREMNPVDIIKDQAFERSNKSFKATLVHLKKIGKGNVEHKNPITLEDMNKISASSATNISTQTGLQNKVFIDVMVYHCNGGRENLRDMKKTDFKINTDPSGLRYVTKRGEQLTKNNRENDNEKSQVGLMYESPGNPRCPVSNFLNYLEKLHPDCDFLWQRPKDIVCSSSNSWYSNMPLGKNTLSNKLKVISTAAKCSNIYTNHCFRATSVTILDDAGFASRDIMTVSGHRSKSSIKYYSRTSENKKREMSAVLTNAVNSEQCEAGPSSLSTTDQRSESPTLLTASQESLILRDFKNSLFSPVNLGLNNNTASSSPVGNLTKFPQTPFQEMEYLAIDSSLIETVQLKSEEPESELTIEDFLEFSTAELKFFLLNLGDSIAGCRAELAERALLAQKRKNNAGPSEPKKFKIEQEQSKGEYTAILEEYGLTDPDVLNAWSVDISALPILDVGKIFHYVLTKEAFDTYYLSDYKTKKAYQYLESVCVRSIKVQSSADFIFVRGSVAQLNAGGDGYDAKKPANISKILMTSDGDIVVSCCTCTEDLYQCCNHVIAVLFRVERLVREMDSTDSQPGTCKSKEDKDESVKPVKITDLFKKKDLFAQSLLGKIPKPSAEEKRKFMEKICRTAPNSLFAQMFRGAIDAGQNLTMGHQSEQQSTVSVRMKDGKQTIVVVGRGPDGPGEKVASSGQGAQRSGVQASVSLPKAAQTSAMTVAAGPPSTQGIQTSNIRVQSVTPLQVVGVPVSGIPVAGGSAAGVAGIQVLSGGQMAELQTVQQGLFMVGGQAVVGAPTLIGGQALVGTQVVAGRQALIGAQVVAGRQAVVGAQAVGGGKSVAEGESLVEGQVEMVTGEGESPTAV